jgi:GNAT superfamily N-acetyltransferase
VPIAIRTAQLQDVDAAAGVLAAAFIDDPVMSFIWPERQQRLSALPRYFAVMLRTHHLSGGGVDVALDGRHIVAAAVWDPPGEWRQPLRGTVRALPQLAIALKTRVPAALTVRRSLDRHHPTTQHWYLCQFGTLPQAQGRGTGTQLLKYRLNACDAQGVPAYLVSNRSATIPLYRAVGFAEEDPIEIRDGLQVWPMRREPLTP